MLRIIIYSLIQCALLTLGQVFLKFALVRMPKFGWTKEFWLGLLTNWHFALCGLFFGAGSLLWIWILKKFPFSVAYPLTSLSFAMGMVAAIIFFHESVSAVRWFGLVLIIIGCLLIAK